MSFQVRRNVVWWTAALAILNLVTVAEIEIRWMWDYYTSWNLVVVYAACVAALVSPPAPRAALLADIASVSSWTTAISYTVAVSLSSDLSRTNEINAPVYWIASSIQHYLVPLLVLCAFKTDTKKRLQALGVVEAVLLFYLLTHDAATLYHTDIPFILIYVGPLAIAAISFCLFLNWEYLSAHSLVW